MITETSTTGSVEIDSGNGHTDAEPRPKRLLDFAQLNTSTPAEQGTEVELENPFTGDVALGTDDRPMTWTLRGEDAPSVQKVVRRHQNKRNERISKGKGFDLDTDTLKAEQVEKLVAATIAFSANFPPLDKQPLTYNAANARLLLEDERFQWLVAQLATALGDRKRFLPQASAT